jgi:hypothetical protein
MSSSLVADPTKPPPYRVEAAVPVWRELEPIEVSVKAELWSHLERLAQEASIAGGDSSTRQTCHFFVRDLVVAYEVSDSRRTITLLAVGQGLPLRRVSEPAAPARSDP